MSEPVAEGRARRSELASSAPGVIAARQSGGGFGGCMLAYVLADQVDAFAAQVRRQYREMTGIEATIHVTEPSGGAGVLES